MYYSFQELRLNIMASRRMQARSCLLREEIGRVRLAIREGGRAMDIRDLEAYLADLKARLAALYKKIELDHLLEEGSAKCQ